MAETKVYAIALDGGTEYEVTVAPTEVEGQFDVTLDGKTYSSTVRDVTPEPPTPTPDPEPEPEPDDEEPQEDPNSDDSGE